MNINSLCKSNLLNIHVSRGKQATMFDDAIGYINQGLPVQNNLDYLETKPLFKCLFRQSQLSIG